MFIVKGVNVFPLGIQEALMTLKPDLTGEFFVALNREPPIKYAPRIYVEVADLVHANRYNLLIERIIDSIQRSNNFTPEVKLVSQGAIASEHKTRRLYRTYHGDTLSELKVLNR